MQVGLSTTLLAGDPRLVDHIVAEVKSQGIFDQFRKECIADVDTKPAYQNLRTRVESSVNSFLCKQTWKPDRNKNQLRENLRKHIHDAAYLDAGVERIVDQVVNPKVYSVFMPQIEDVVYKFLGIERPKDRERNGAKTLKDLLPKDLDPVSPESDKNSLKDVSLESVDTNISLNFENKDQALVVDANQVKTNFHGLENVNDTLVSDYDRTKHRENSENQSDQNIHNSGKNVSTSNLNVSIKSDDKTEEEEEDSPMFEPIDIMNFNESNDSHLSGISELTSHRSRSPDFFNEFSRDNLEFSNHDSQLSKVSSDSRLSIVTDFGLSNYTSMHMGEFKEDNNKRKFLESADSKCTKNNFKTIRDIESNKVNSKERWNSFENLQSRDIVQDRKDLKNVRGGKGTPDSTDRAIKDKNDSQDLKEKSKDSNVLKTKSNRDKYHLKESNTYKHRDRDHRKKQSLHSSLKHDQSEKCSKEKYKEKPKDIRDISEKSKEYLIKFKVAEKSKEEKRDSDRKDTGGKDLKDIYKEKIRELREKKQLTEKEKLAKDSKEPKSSKEPREKKDSTRDRKDLRCSKTATRQDDKSSDKDEKSSTKRNNKSYNKGTELKDSKNDSKDRGKRDDKRQSKDNKEVRSKGYVNNRNDLIEKGEKLESKTDVKNEMQSRDSELSDHTDTKRDTKDTRNEQYDGKKDCKADSHSKEKKRKDDKKSKAKAKDDHSSLRKNTNNRRSTDRDGSNGSNSKNSPKNSSSSHTNSSKTGSTNLTKESSGTSNSSSETSDNVDVSPSDEIKLPIDSMWKGNLYNKSGAFEIKLTNKLHSNSERYINSDLMSKTVDLGHAELTLPLKKRPLQADADAPNPNDFKVKKPKFAKNFQEAKKLMKIRKKLEKQRLREYEAAREKFKMSSQPNKPDLTTAIEKDKVNSILPDDERVQIIEVTDDDYEEPYPDLSMKEINISLERQSITSLENPLIFNPQDKLHISEKHSSLSAMEKSIRQSLENMISDKKFIEADIFMKDANESETFAKILHSNASVATVQYCANVSKTSEKWFKPVTTKNNLKHTNLYDVQAIFNNTSKETETYQALVHPHEKSDCVHKEQISALDSKEIETESREKLTKCGESKSDGYLSSAASSGLIISVNNNKNSGSARQCQTANTRDILPSSDTNSNCLYFECDNERAVKFSQFLQSLEVDVLEDKMLAKSSSESVERILESLGGQIVSSLPKPMAPPKPKRKHSTSPLMDILLNNTNNNNNRQKIKESFPEENLSTTNKQKLGRSKKQRAVATVCGIQNLPNGDNFVMPPSPESDVSASSEKNSVNLLKEDKSRPRSSQRYSSDDLYKPRLFFSSSSRRSRRSNQA